MGLVIDLDRRRRRQVRSLGRPSQSPPANAVVCSHCGEPHPIMRLQGGEQRCLTAFFDGTHWFCRNRGCRRAWLETQD
jgi:hypothetical protein